MELCASQKNYMDAFKLFQAILETGVVPSQKIFEIVQFICLNGNCTRFLTSMILEMKRIVDVCIEARQASDEIRIPIEIPLDTFIGAVNNHLYEEGILHIFRYRNDKKTGLQLFMKLLRGKGSIYSLEASNYSRRKLSLKVLFFSYSFVMSMSGIFLLLCYDLQFTAAIS